MIRLTEGTFKLTLFNNVFIFRLDHIFVDTIPASSVVTTKQTDRLTILEIEEKFALTAHEVRSDRHLYMFKFYFL